MYLSSKKLNRITIKEIKEIETKKELADYSEGEIVDDDEEYLQIQIEKWLLKISKHLFKETKFEKREE